MSRDRLREEISARKLARIAKEDRERGQFTRQNVIGMFQDFRDLYGRNPTAADLRKKHGLPSYRTLVKLFGSLKNALIEAGLMDNF